jgi:hypothetical protein
MEDSIESCLQDTDVIAVYRQYIEVSDPEKWTIMPLKEWVENVDKGDRRGYSLKESVLSCIRTAIWHRTTSWEDQMKLAKPMDTEKMRSMGMNTQKAYQFFNEDPIEASIDDCTLEDSLKARKLEIYIKELDIDKLREFILGFYKQTLMKEALYKKMLKVNISGS